MVAPLKTCTTTEQRGVVRFFVGKKYGYPQRNAAHMGSISLWISFAASIFLPTKNAQRHAVLSWYMYSGAPPSCNSYVCTVMCIPIVVRHNKAIDSAAI
jgi:hypothetical protein